MVESPKRVRELLQDKQKSVSERDDRVLSAMPDLLAIFHQGELPTNVRIFQGEAEYLDAFFTILEEEKNEVLFFGSTEDFVGFLSEENRNKWIKLRIEKKIRARTLALPSKMASELEKRNKEELREIRFLDSNPFSSSFQVYANKVIIWQPKGPIALLIEDQYIVQMLKAMFEMLWKSAKKI